MAKPQVPENESAPDDNPEAAAVKSAGLDIDSPEREGNDIPSLLGSGAPTVTVKANVASYGLAVGETQTFVQTEELRLLVQQGFLEVVE